MAEKEKVYKVAPCVSLTSKGGIIDDGTVVTAENFASEEVFNTLVKAKKIVTAEDYNKIWEELNKPKEDEATVAKKEHDAELQKKIDDAVAKATAKATEEARKQFEAEYAKKEAEAKEQAEKEAKEKAEEEKKADDGKKAEEEAKKAAQNGNNGGNK